MLNRHLKTIFLLFSGVLLLHTGTHARVRLPAIFSDNMVLQQQTDVAIWGWADSGKGVTVTPSWDNESYKTKADKSGKWKLKIATPAAGGPYTVTISDGSEVELSNVLIGEVWLCSGQSNMEMPMKGYKGQPVKGSNDAILRSANDRIRFITVPRKSTTIPQDDFEGTWKVAAPATVAEFSATAYYYGRLLNEILDVPVGLIHVSFGGSNVEAWMSKEMLAPYPEVTIPVDDEAIGEQNRTPTVLFNGMLSPVVGYTMKGCIWYQGESNTERPDAYEDLFPDMVRHWRALWGVGEFPFYYVQIAPFDYNRFYPDGAPDKANSAYLRDAQRKAQYKIPNSGMVVLLDAGEKENIHPADKQTPGERLAYWALGQTYGIEGIGYASPDYDEINIQDSSVVVTFKNIPNGITSFGREVTTFEVAGADRKFYPAKAVVRRKSVVLHSPEVKEPVAVRYAFKNFVVGELFSTEGLPVTSFRTDDW